MKKFIFLVMGICSMGSLTAQSFKDVIAANKMKYIPVEKTYSTTHIAAFVKENFVSDSEKVFAIYSWVISNIKYEVEGANVINLGPDPDAKINVALRRRKGVCENFAAIFNDITLKTGIKSFVVSGYTKQNGSVDKMGHCWCAVNLYNKWYLCDPTWDSGLPNIKYFLMSPSEMIALHMPFDPMWQLLDHPISHQQFYSDILFTNKKSSFFNYNDSIAAFFLMDSLQQLISTAIRIENQGIYNDLVKNNHGKTKMNIEIIREDKDVELYNSAVSNVNMATNSINNFILYRNKQFKPTITDKELQAMLAGIDIKIAIANKNLDEITRSEATFTFSTDALRDRVNALCVRFKEQREFLYFYLAASAANRRLLFYNNQITLSDKK